MTLQFNVRQAFKNFILDSKLPDINEVDLSPEEIEIYCQYEKMEDDSFDPRPIEEQHLKRIVLINAEE